MNTKSVIIIAIALCASHPATAQEIDTPTHTCYGMEIPGGLQGQIIDEGVSEARVLDTEYIFGLDSPSLQGDVEIPSVLEYDNREFSVTTIGENTLTFGIRSLKLPSTIEFIEDGNVCGTECTDIELPESLIMIGDHCFGTNQTIESFRLPDRLRYIGSFSFCHNDMLKDVEFGKGLVKIGEGSFSNNPELREVSLSNSVRIIKNGAFCNNLKLEKIRLPRYICYERWGGPVNLFNGCPNIKVIEWDTDTPGKTGGFTNSFTDCFDKVDKRNCMLVVPDGCSEAFRNHEYWKDFHVIEQSSYRSNLPSQSGISAIHSENVIDSTGLFTLTGLRIEDKASLKSGDIYIEVFSDGSTSKNIK